MKETIYIIFIGSYYKMTKVNMGGGGGLWRLTPLSTIFQLHRGG
jgi:hypothetical protein